jgi:hypothetical protein
MNLRVALSHDVALQGKHKSMTMQCIVDGNAFLYERPQILVYLWEFMGRIFLAFNTSDLRQINQERWGSMRGRRRELTWTEPEDGGNSS